MIDKSKTRNSSIELLRMLAMCGIIVLHYNDGKAFIYAQTDSVKTGILYLLESVAICGVDLFVLISGYFLSKTQKRSILKPLELLVQVSIFSTGFYLLKSVVKHDFLF